MSHSIPTAKKLFFRMLIFGVILSLLHIALERAMAFAGSDIALIGWVPPLNFAIILCDATFFFAVYALLFSAISLCGMKQPAILLLPVALALFKHIVNWLVFLLTENVTQAVAVRLSFMTAASAIAIELLQYGLVLAVLFALRRRPDGFRLLGICGVMLAINLLSRMIGDIEYGAPSSAKEIGIMLAYYAFDIFLYCPVAYFTMRYIIKRQNKKDPTE